MSHRPYAAEPRSVDNEKRRPPVWGSASWHCAGRMPGISLESAARRPPSTRAKGHTCRGLPGFIRYAQRLRSLPLGRSSTETADRSTPALWTNHRARTRRTYRPPTLPGHPPYEGAGIAVPLLAAAAPSEQASDQGSGRRTGGGAAERSSPSRATRGQASHQTTGQASHQGRRPQVHRGTAAPGGRRTKAPASPYHSSPPRRPESMYQTRGRGTTGRRGPRAASRQGQEGWAWTAVPEARSPCVRPGACAAVARWESHSRTRVWPGACAAVARWEGRGGTCVARRKGLGPRGAG